MYKHAILLTENFIKTIDTSLGILPLVNSKTISNYISQVIQKLFAKAADILLRI